MTLDVSTHGDQAFSEIHHFRFPGSVFQDGFTIGQRGSHHQVFRTGDGHGVQKDVRAFQAAIGLCLDITVFDLDVGAHLFQAMNVQVHRPATDGTATRQGHFRFTKVRYQRP